MGLFRNIIFIRICWLFVALTILNLSVDAPDLYAEHINEDLSYDEVESALEYVLEHCFDLGNIMPESEGNDDESSFKVEKSDILLLSLKANDNYWNISNFVSINKPNHENEFSNQESLKPLSPPPWI